MVPLITEVVLRSESLENLDLNDNIIDDEGGAKLVEMVHQLLSDTGGNSKNWILDITLSQKVQLTRCYRSCHIFIPALHSRFHCLNSGQIV